MFVINVLRAVHLLNYSHIVIFFRYTAILFSELFNCAVRFFRFSSKTLVINCLSVSLIEVLHSLITEFEAGCMFAICFILNPFGVTSYFLLTLKNWMWCLKLKLLKSFSKALLKNNFVIHNLPLFKSNLIVNLYILSRTQSHISKYKLSFQDRSYNILPFHDTFQISPLSS